MEAKHEGGNYLKVKFVWLSLNGETIELQKHDSGFFRDWTLI
jgi:hypothetical protein